MNPEWIKITDRKPTSADYPIWVFLNTGEILSWNTGFPDQCTHWMHVMLPAPPPKEKTQQELDEEGYDTCPEAKALGTWHAALKWEREQVGAIMTEIGDMPAGCDYLPHMKAVIALRKRCGLQ